MPAMLSDGDLRSRRGRMKARLKTPSSGPCDSSGGSSNWLHRAPPGWLFGVFFHCTTAPLVLRILRLRCLAASAALFISRCAGITHRFPVFDVEPRTDPVSGERRSIPEAESCRFTWCLFFTSVLLRLGNKTVCVPLALFFDSD